MAFMIKVIVEAEAVENSSEIARDYGLSESMVQCRGQTRRLFFLASLKCLQNMQKWAVSQANNGVVFTSERANITFGM